MATSISFKTPEELVGMLVYEPYSPQKCGKIVKVLDIPHRYENERTVMVRWKKDRKETIVETFHLQDFRALVEDHRRKYNKGLNEILALELL